MLGSLWIANASDAADLIASELPRFFQQVGVSILRDLFFEFPQTGRDADDHPVGQSPRGLPLLQQVADFRRAQFLAARGGGIIRADGADTGTQAAQSQHQTECEFEFHDGYSARG